MQKTKFQLSNVLTVSFAHMVHDTFTAFLAPLLPLLREKLGISYAIAGLLSAIQKSPALFNPLVGIIADRISLRFLVIVGPAITAICMSLLGVAANVWALIVLLLITGISSTLFHVPSPVMIKEVAGNKTGLGMSFYMLGGELARTIGPLLILGAVTLWGLEGSYRLMPIGILASVLLFFRFKNIKVNKKVKKKKEKPHHTLKKLLPLFIFIGSFSFFREIMKATLTLFLPAYITSKGQSLWFGGISLSIMQFSGAMGSLLSGHFSDMIGRKKILLIISIAMPVVMLLFTFADGILMIPALIVLGFFTFASNPVLLAFIQDTNSENPAFLNSIYMTMSFFVSSIVTLGIGFFADQFGLHLTYRICALFGMGLIPVSLFLIKKAA
ncbi:MAG: MFS transporter [Fidelibacterota bacterium]